MKLALIANILKKKTTTTFHPQGDHDRAYNPEVIAIRENKREKRWEIHLRRKKLADKLDLEENAVTELFPNAATEEETKRSYDYLKNWWAAIDNELLQARIPLALLEQQQQLGTTEMELKHWQLPAGLTEKQQAVLCYFLPFVETIKQFETDAAHCFTTFLESTVRVVKLPIKQSKKTPIKGQSIANWQVGLRDTVGGEASAQKPSLHIEINCENEAKLTQLQLGMPLRTLFEQIVLPRFVEDGVAYKIDLKTPEQPFEIDTNSRIGYAFISA